MREPQQGRSAESARQMLDAALGLISEGGLAAVTISAVAARSGQSNGSLYHRFGSRAQLLLAAQAQFLDRIESEFRTVLSEAASITDDRVALRAVADFFVTPFELNRSVFRALVIEKIDLPELRERGLESSRRFTTWTNEFLSSRLSVAPDTVAALVYLLDATAVRSMIGDDRGIVNRDELATVLTSLLTSNISANPGHS